MAHRSPKDLRYLAPNLVTCAGMVVGLLAVMTAVGGDYESAAWLVLVSVLLDKLDGTVARLLRATSRFGVELDSFSDFVSFGIAPAAIVVGLMTADPRYLHYWNPWFVRMAGVAFVVLAALRLARFNVTTETIGGRVFLGIPTTLTAATLCTFLLTAWKRDLPPAAVAGMPVALIVFGLWMVSNVPLPKLRATGTRWWDVLVGVNAVGAYVLVPFRVFPDYLFVLCTCYALGGSVYATLRMRGEPEASLGVGPQAEAAG